MNRIDLARSLFQNNFNCAQSVFAACSESYGLSLDIALKIASGLGGGVRCAEVCGAATGAVLVIGLKNGHYKADDESSKVFCNTQTVEFMRRFRERNGHIICRDLLGIDTSIGDGRERAKALNLFNTVCLDMVQSALEILADMGY